VPFASLLQAPGFVVLAKRGQHVYHKAFGLADKEAGTNMELDAQFRCFSMTKAMACAVAQMFVEKVHSPNAACARPEWTC